MAKNITLLVATIPLSGTDSAVVTAPTNGTLLGFFTPAALTGTSISFKVSPSSSEAAVPVKPANTLYSITVGPSVYYPVDDHFNGLKFLTVVSNAAEAAERSITLIFGQKE